MIERVYQVTCDVCGDTIAIEYATVPEGLRAEKWRTGRGTHARKHICADCWSRGWRWADATMHEGT